MAASNGGATEDPVIHILWINAGLSCDGDSVALTAATQPSIEEIALGALPGLPKIAVHWPLIDFDNGPVGGVNDFIEWFFKAERGELDPFVLVVEGSIPNESIKSEGYWSGLRQQPGHRPADDDERVARPPDAEGPRGRGGRDLRHLRRHPRDGRQSDRRHGRARTTSAGTGSRRPASRSCASRAARPIRTTSPRPSSTCCTRRPASAPMIPLDEALRPTWLFGATVHEGCDRAGYYEQGDFATEYGSPKCIVKLGCWGPVVKCNVPKRGWINGVGGCPNVGGICIGCTMPGFPDKFMPFMDEPPGARDLDGGERRLRGLIRGLRGFTARTLDKEPKWRHPGKELTTGYERPWQ